MKVAFVNQPIDCILPPRQNSVGVCTYGVSQILAKHCDVVVYGSRDNSGERGTELRVQGVTYKFFSCTRSDQWIFRVRKNYSRLTPGASPLSTSGVMHLSYARQVAMDLSQQGCDVIHIQHCSQFVPIIREYNPTAKIVLHLHAEWFSQGGQRVFEQRLENVDLVTAVSGYVAEKTRREFPSIRGRCEVMYNGIDAREFTQEKDYRGARSKTRRILYAGAISPHRGVHILLEAFKRVVERYPDVHLELVGAVGNYPLQETFDIRDGALRKSVAPYYRFKPMSLFKAKLFPGSANGASYKSSLEAMMPAEVSKRVTFRGWVDRPQLIERYYDCDIFVLPSICNDSFGIPVVEAMAAGAPVVASRSGGVVETVKDRETGFIVEKNDPQQLANALLRLLESDALRESLGRAGRERALENFTWDRVAETMLMRYRALTETDSPTEADILLEYAPVHMAG